MNIYYICRERQRFAISISLYLSTYTYKQDLVKIEQNQINIIKIMIYNIILITMSIIVRYKWRYFCINNYWYYLYKIKPSCFFFYCYSCFDYFFSVYSQCHY